MKSPKVDVLILHMNGEQIIKNCLESLKKIDYNNYQIHLLLNSTTDKSESIAKKYKVKIYKSKDNIGFAEGNNFLIKKTTGKYCVMLNNDTEVDKNWLKEMVKCSEKHNADIIQPKILALRDKKMFEYAGGAGGYVDKYIIPFCRGRIFNNLEKDIGQYDHEARLFWACGSCMMIRRDLINKIGSLDKNMFMYSEELDFCWRTNLSGGKIIFCPKSKVYHLGSYTIKKEKMNRQKEFLIHRNHFYTFLKNYSSGSIIKRIMPLLCLEIGAGIIEPRRTIAIWKAFFWILANINLIKRKRKEIKKLRKLQDNEIFGIYPKNIIIQHYILRKNKFNDLKWQPNP